MIQFEEAMDYLECEIAKVSTDLEALPWEDKNAENWLQCAEIWLDAMREKEERILMTIPQSTFVEMSKKTNEAVTDIIQQVRKTK